MSLLKNLLNQDDHEEDEDPDTIDIILDPDLPNIVQLPQTPNPFAIPITPNPLEDDEDEEED